MRESSGELSTSTRSRKKKKRRRMKFKKKTTHLFAVFHALAKVVVRLALQKLPLEVLEHRRSHRDRGDDWHRLGDDFGARARGAAAVEAENKAAWLVFDCFFYFIVGFFISFLRRSKRREEERERRERERGREREKR